jgi:hypothetical protein
MRHRFQVVIRGAMVLVSWLGMTAGWMPRAGRQRSIP